MIEKKNTKCECPIAGYCKRHGIEKSAHLHKLCQNHEGYFNLWEQCRGPKQNPNDCNKNETIPTQPDTNSKQPETKLPSTVEMAKNFASSAINHIKNGMTNASDEVQAERLRICSECPHAVENKSRCGKCGCFLQTKAKWASSSCPIGMW